MKNSFIGIATLISTFLFSVNNVSAVNKLKYDSLLCLQIEGKVTNVEDGNGECLVELINQNVVLESYVLKEGKQKFKFLLEKNSFYSIRISKNGYVDKLVSINTELLTNSEGIHIFRFETGLISQGLAVKLNQDILDFPVTIINYDYEVETFVYNIEYTAYIKKELYKTSPVKIQKPQPILIVDTTNLASK